MSDSEKATGSVPDAAAQQRSRKVGLVAVLAGVLAALLALVGLLTSGEVDMIYLLLFAGGMLVSVLGFRRMRGPRKKD